MRRNPFGFNICPGYPKPGLFDKATDVTKGIWNLGHTSEGCLYPSHCKPFSSGVHANTANQEVFTTAGFKLFYGQHPDGNVIEFIKKGPIGQRDMAKIRGLGVLMLWQSNFTSEMWLINGQERTTKYAVDLSPSATTKEAAKWGKALGYY